MRVCDRIALFPDSLPVLRREPGNKAIDRAGEQGILPWAPQTFFFSEKGPHEALKINSIFIFLGYSFMPFRFLSLLGTDIYFRCIVWT